MKFEKQIADEAQTIIQINHFSVLSPIAEKLQLEKLEKYQLHVKKERSAVYTSANHSPIITFFSQAVTAKAVTSIVNRIQLHEKKMPYHGTIVSNLTLQNNLSGV